MAAPLAVLKHRQIRTFATLQAANRLGTWMNGLAFAWLAWTTTHSTVWVGIVVSAQQLPVCVTIIGTGSLVDRVYRRGKLGALLRAAYASDALQCATVLALYLSGTLTKLLLVGLAAFLGVSQSVEDPAAFTFSAGLVSSGERGNSSVVLGVLNLSARLTAALLAAVLLNHHIALAFGCNLVADALVFAMIGRLHPTEAVETQERQARKGWLKFVRQRSMVAVLLVLAVQGTAGMSDYTLMPALMGNARDYSLLAAFAACGSLTGGLAMSINAGMQRHALQIGLACKAVALATIALSVTLSLRPALFPAVMLGGIGGAAVFLGGMAKIQEITPMQYRGRVTAATLLVGEINPAGAPAVGAAAQAFGLATPLAISAGLIVSAGLAYRAISGRSQS